MEICTENFFGVQEMRCCGRNLGSEWHSLMSEKLICEEQYLDISTVEC